MGKWSASDERGLAVFHFLRHRRNESSAFLYAFDLLELDGADMRRAPIEVRKATLASILRKSRPGVRLNYRLKHPDGALLFAHACKMGLEGMVSSAWDLVTGRDDRQTGSSSRSGSTGGDPREAEDDRHCIRPGRHPLWLRADAR